MESSIADVEKNFVSSRVLCFVFRIIIIIYWKIGSGIVNGVDI